ncbi:MAG: FAD-dependent oxidoreductase, partial [Candidatus Lokiarchaeota archaeon]|nr:FAD-dependent oxidoreductase [Candidatus Lokiarchaeota archaeon]
GAIVEHAGGRGAVLARQVIDASANAVMAWWLAGQEGCTVNPASQRGLTQSYVVIDGVDVDKLVNWALELPPGTFETYPADPEQLRRHVETGRLFWFKSAGAGQPAGVFEGAEEVENLGGLFKAGFTPVGFYFKWSGNYPRHGAFTVDGPYYREDSLDGRVWSSEHARNLHGSWGLFKIMRHMPGFEHAYIARTCERMGLRTTRIPVGLYTITGDDLKSHKVHPDAVGVGDWHDRTKRGDKGTWGYHVPLRALIPKEIDGLAFCGRAVSFDRGAMNAHRTIATTLVCSQGAGVAVAAALHGGDQLRHVNHGTVKRLLEAQDVVLGLPHVP